MTGTKSLLNDYVKKNGPAVTYGDNGKGKTKGTRLVKCKDVTDKNVSYVKGLKHNLISISQLCDADYEVHFTKDEGRILNSKKVQVLSAPRKDDIYILDMNSTSDSLRPCLITRSQADLTWRWQKRLSHLSIKDILKVAKDQLVKG